jgi:hypothetical protein
LKIYKGRKENWQEADQKEKKTGKIWQKLLLVKKWRKLQRKCSEK